MSSSPAVRLTLLLGAAIALGCTERVVHDDIEQLCIDHCRVGLECGFNTRDSSEDECVERCIPSTKKETCPQEIALMRCWSRLSCEEVEAYDAGILEYARTGLMSEADFPCRDEVVEHVMSCY